MEYRIEIGKGFSPESILKCYLNLSNIFMIISDMRERISLCESKTKVRAEA